MPGTPRHLVTRAKRRFPLRAGGGAPRMDFLIQYFARYDQLVFEERVDAEELVDALDRARAVVRESEPSDPSGDEPQLLGYVILDGRGRQVARGYRRDA